VGIDLDHNVVRALRDGQPPVFEPGLSRVIEEAQAAGRLSFSVDAGALTGALLAWITFDTPVDEDDRADVESVLGRSVELLGALSEGTLVVVSSQLPVGSTARLADLCEAHRGDRDLRFACIPENLRLGQALDSFREPDRIVVGVRNERDRRELVEVLAPFTANIEWMGVESAEMTKHALNGFLATSVAFINEVASVCESVGADATEVSRGLKSERRVGPRAYLSPGDAFAGGTLARDIEFLRELAQQHELPDHVFAGVAESNIAHKLWTRRKLLGLLGDGDGLALEGRSIAVWGLTYKPGTDTLRRSSAVELCRWMISQGATVRVHDPAVAGLPDDLPAEIELCPSALAAADGAVALVICTAWPQYREISVEDVASVLAGSTVIDAAGFLADSLGTRPELRYVRVGSLTRSIHER
jgi:UDPglucose 6-dehydrogenase